MTETTSPGAGTTSAGGTWVRACDLADVPEQGALKVDVADFPLAVVRDQGELFAIYDVCSHAFVFLSEGAVADCAIECWLHAASFDLRTGQPLTPPATEPVPVYPVKVEDDVVFVELPQES
jgi:3-phenylpropionate/trans-cinnamate dioxygenase ferredoxin subunit